MQKKHLINPAANYGKNSQLSRNRGNKPKHRKGHIHDNPTTSVPLKIRNKTGMSTLTTLIQHSTESPSHKVRHEEIKGIQVGKE